MTSLQAITYKTRIYTWKCTMTVSALQLLDEMRRQRLQPNTIIYNTLALHASMVSWQSEPG